MTEDTEELPRAECYDCEREAPRRYLQYREVLIDNPEGESGYTETRVLMCSDCIGTRYGYDCPHCGLTYNEQEKAEYCCKRRRGEAPDCPECGLRMQREAWGHDAMGPTVEYASCEKCGMEWGKYTGWHPPEEAEAGAEE